VGHGQRVAASQARLEDAGRKLGPVRVGVPPGPERPGGTRVAAAAGPAPAPGAGGLAGDGRSGGGGRVATAGGRSGGGGRVAAARGSPGGGGGVAAARGSPGGGGPRRRGVRLPYPFLNGVEVHDASLLRRPSKQPKLDG